MATQALIQAPIAAPAPRLLDQVCRAQLHYGRPEPGERFAEWVRRFVIFHGMRHPRELFHEDVGRFLDRVAQTEKDPLRTDRLRHALRVPERAISTAATPSMKSRRRK